MRLAEHWRRRRAFIGYVILLALVAVSLELHHTSNQNEIREAQRLACLNAQTITANQRLVLENLITFQVAALASPYLRLEAQRELPSLQRALRAIEPGAEQACR